MTGNDKGMSLVELILALGIFAIVTIILDSLTFNFYKSF
jgi:prepilin-type N-terminal cleavage/methylation domain-containing protein